MPVLRLNNINLHTLVLGDSGPLLVMLHGLIAGSMATWYFQFAPRLAKRFRVVLFDMRGHGKSEKPLEGYDVKSMAEDLREVIAHYSSQYPDANNEVHLVGHSYGALVSLYYAAYREQLDAEKISSLILIDAPLPASRFISPGMDKVTDRDSALAVISEILAHMGIDGGRRLENYMNNLTYLYLDTSLKKDVAASGDIPDAQLSTITVPVSLIYGIYSDCMEVGQRLQSVLPNARLSTIECGHYVTVEQPEQLVGLIHQHFEEFAYG